MTKEILTYRNINMALDYTAQKTVYSYLYRSIINEGQAEKTSAQATLYTIACLALFIRNHTTEKSKKSEVNKETTAQLLSIYKKAKLTAPCDRNLRMRIQAARYVLDNAKADSTNNDKALNDLTTFCEKFKSYTEIVERATKKKSAHHNGAQAGESEKLNKRIDSLFKDISESATLTTKDKLSIFNYIKDKASARLAGMDDKPKAESAKTTGKKQPAKTTGKKQLAKKAA